MKRTAAIIIMSLLAFTPLCEYPVYSQSIKQCDQYGGDNFASNAACYAPIISVSNSYDPTTLNSFMQYLNSTSNLYISVFPYSPFPANMGDLLSADFYYDSSVSDHNGYFDFADGDSSLYPDEALSTYPNTINTAANTLAAYNYASTDAAFTSGSVTSSLSGTWTEYFKWNGSGRPPDPEYFAVDDTLYTGDSSADDVNSAASSSVRDSLGTLVSQATSGYQSTNGIPIIVVSHPNASGIYTVNVQASAKGYASAYTDNWNNNFDAQAASSLYINASPLYLNVSVAAGDPGDPSSGEQVSCTASVGVGYIEDSYAPAVSWSIGQRLYSSSGQDGTFAPVSDNSKFSIVGNGSATNSSALFTATFANIGWYRVQIIASVTWTDSSTGESIGPITSDPNSGWVGK